MKFTQTHAKHLIALAINEKLTKVGTKVFINTSRPASINDLTCLLSCIHKGKSALKNAYTDAKGYWHFITLD